MKTRSWEIIMISIVAMMGLMGTTRAANNVIDFTKKQTATATFDCPEDAKITASLGTSSQSLKQSSDTKTNSSTRNKSKSKVRSKDAAKASQIQAKVLVSNAILEAFGNARTFEKLVVI